MLRTAKEIFIEGSLPILLKDGVIKKESEVNDYFDKFFQEEPELINTIFSIINQARKEVIEECAEKMGMIYWDGHHKNGIPTKYHQSGADNIQPERQSILKLINELK